MALEITKGEYRAESTGLIVVHPLGVNGSIGRNIATCNSLFIPETEMKANQSLIIDAGNTYQQCLLLPSELLAQRNELKALLDMVFTSQDVYDLVCERFFGKDILRLNNALELVNSITPQG